MDKIAILIPCYNEELTIGKVVKDFLLNIPDCIVYVYDNNSNDNTVRNAKEAGAIVRYETEQGKGNVVRRMFREIDAECYILTDGDDTYPVDIAKDMINDILHNNIDMVIGDRLSSTYFSENKRPFHNFGNLLVRKSINILFNTNIKDIMTGYRAFSYNFVKTFPVLSRGFEIETEMTIHAIDKKMLISNKEVNYKDRQIGSMSKLNTYIDGVKVLLTIYKLFRIYKPLTFFSIISIFLSIISTLFIIPIGIEYFNTNLVPRIPTLIVCCFMYIAAIQSLFCGLILENISQNSKREFEFKLYCSSINKLNIKR